MIGTAAGEYALHLFHWFWQTALVAALALAVIRLAPRSSVRFRAAVASLAFWKFLLPPMLPSPTGVFSHLDVFGANGGTLLARAASPPWAAAILAFAALHALGAAVRLGGALGEWQSLRRSLAGARRVGRLRVAVTHAGGGPQVPMAFGFLHPAILLPSAVLAELSPRGRRILVAHERAHLERGHGLAAIVEEIGAAIAWIHPLLRPVVRERRRLREERCDAAVIARLGIAPSDYAACLVAVAAICGGHTAPGSAPAATSSAAALRCRIAALGRRVRWTGVEVAAAVLLWATLLPGIQPWPSGPAAGHSQTTGAPR